MENIKRNHEGYYDPTAYLAIRNVTRKGEETMYINKGDIFTFEKQNGTEGLCLIISPHEKISTILLIIDNYFENAKEIRCHGIKYTDLDRLQYVFNDNLLDFKRALTDDEYNDIMNGIKQSLGIEDISTSETGKSLIDENKYLTMQLKDEKKRCMELEDKYNDLKSMSEECRQFLQVTDTQKEEDYIRVETERDLYKNLYEKALEKMLGATA